MKVLDSATGPSLAACLQARALGYEGWIGYVGPSAGWRSAMWPDECFAHVRSAGMVTAACFFGPDARLALAECRRVGVMLCFGDVEADDPGAYEPGWLDLMNMSNDVVAGPYGLSRTVAGMQAPVHWYAAELRNGRPMIGCQERYNVTVAGIPVDVNDFDPAMFGGTLMLSETRLLGRGVYALAVELGKGRPATVAEMDAASKNAEDPANSGGWEWTIENAMGEAGARLASLTSQVSGLAAQVALLAKAAATSSPLPADVVEAIHHIRAEIDALKV